MKKRQYLEGGVVLKNQGRRTRKLLTIEGEIEYSRTVYVPADKNSAKLLLDKYGLKSVIPLDMALKIDNLPFKVSPEMMLDIARRAVNASSYEDLQIYYEADRNILISDDQLRKITNYVGKIVYDYDCARRDVAMKVMEESSGETCDSNLTDGDVLYIQMDGAMFNTRKTENGSSWKENKLGLVFSSKNLISHKNKRGEIVHRIGAREYISYVGSSEEFMKFLYSIALYNGLKKHKSVVIISDGARWIKNFKETYCSNLNVVHILDFSHVKENVYKFADAFVRGKNAKGKWAEEVCNLIRKGDINGALSMAEPYKEKRKPGIPNIYTYLLNNQNSMDYPSYIAAGYFIGSGAIESGHKSTMQDRLKLPGMRWDITNAQYVLSAKIKYESNQWDSVVVPLVFKALGI